MSTVSVAAVARNLGLYAVGVGAAVVGALGLSEAVALNWGVAAFALTLGIALVIAVHEYFGGPVPASG